MTGPPDAIAQFGITSVGIQQNFDRDNVELIWQQVVVDDDNEPLPDNISRAYITDVSMFEKG